MNFTCFMWLDLIMLNGLHKALLGCSEANSPSEVPNWMSDGKYSRARPDHGHLMRKNGKQSQQTGS